MVRCELCGVETGSPTTVTVESAELDVCDDCADLGTAVESSTGGGTTKYDTGSTGGSTTGSETESGTTSTSATGSSSGGSGGGSDPFADVDDLTPDYGDRIREAREARDLSQTDLSDQLNEKASLIRKLEHGETLPSDEVQRKIESALDIDLSAGATVPEADWGEGESAGDVTLGDIVEQKNS
jgi:putative transcription factor